LEREEVYIRRGGSVMKGDRGAVLVTGAAAGIGKECALILDRSGFRVFAGIRNEKAADELRRLASELLFPVMLDITDGRQIAEAADTVAKELGPDRGLFGLVNNAGIVMGGPLEFLPIDKLRRQMEVNVIGHMAVTQAFLPLIRMGHGRIVNIGTAGCHLPVPFLAAYQASKIAIESLAVGLRRELSPWGIHVSIIEPGIIETGLWDKSYAELDRIQAELPARGKEFYTSSLGAGRRFIENMRRKATVPAKSVAENVRQCLEARRPKTLYVVGKGARLPYLIAKFFPDRLADWGVRKALGM
jgi:NAD(P)-dependent dehydrogenase (short-subunit alcohol dehydrogenase family)